MGRAVAYAVLACAIGAATIHAVAWGVAARAILYEASPHLPRIQSIIVLGLGLLTLRAAASLRRGTRQLVVVAVIVSALAAFLTLPLTPLRFEGSGYMADAADNINDRAKFQQRFPIAVGPTTSFHSYLGA